MSRKPLVTLIIPNRNGQKFLREAVKSILADSAVATEIIIVDDGSTDQSKRQVWDLPVRWISLGKSHGQAYAQNIGVEEAVGRYIGFLDADDRLAPRGLSARTAFLEENEESQVVMGTIAGLIDAKGNVTGSYEDSNRHFKELPRRITWSRYRAGALAIPSQSWLRLYRREALEKVGPFATGLICAHDHDHLCRSLKTFAIETIRQPVAFYRLHGDNLSGRFIRRRFQLWPRFTAETFYVNLTHGVSVE